MADYMSHSSRGAWIEIEGCRHGCNPKASRTPHGVRGLKYGIDIQADNVAESHSSRGAWIEICGREMPIRASMVALLTGCVD